MSDRSDIERDIAEEDELRNLLRSGDGQLVAPPVALVEQRAQQQQSFPAFATIAAALLVVVVAIGIGSRQVGAPTSSVSPSPLPTPAASGTASSPSASPSGVTDAARAAAISRVAALTGEVLRVDHADAKLVRWSDFEAVAQTGNAAADERQVWIVAVSGEIAPSFAHGNRFAWGMFVVDANTNGVLGVTAGSAAWPPVFGLVREPAGPARPEPTIAFPQPSVPDNNVSCGVLQPGSITSGEGSGADELRPAVSAAYGVTPLFRVGLPPTGRPAYGTYTCLRARPGAPMAGLVGYLQPGDPAYIAPSALTPTGFALPAGCRYVGEPTSELFADQVVWKLDCGAAANTSARSNLSSAIAAQGWRTCGSGATSSSWSKDGRTLAITESSGSTGDYPRLTLRPSAIC